MDFEHKGMLRRVLTIDLFSIADSNVKCQEMLIPCCPDENELASRLAEQGVAISLKERQRRRAVEIEEALSRLNTPDCGLCRDCGGAIGVKRLLACLTTELCIDCKHALEKAGAGQWDWGSA
jgi:DnaK suppressor protein